MSTLPILATAVLLASAAVTSDEGATQDTVRVVVLPLQSYEVDSSALDELTGHLRRRVSEDSKLVIIDPTPMLVEAGADDWLHSDKLLFDGMQDYNNLEYAEAVEKLRTAAELSQQSYRDLADAHGRRRLREIYLYLGLSRLEQGETAEAEAWFVKAVQTDPAFEPDARTYSPAAREAYAAAREKLDGAPELSRERLRQVCALADADVILGGAVTVEPNPGMGLELVIYQREGSLLQAQRIHLAKSPSEVDVAEVSLDESLPPLLAALAGRPWPPEPAVGARDRLTWLAAEYSGLVLPSVDMPLGVKNQPYLYTGDLSMHGAGVVITPWRTDRWAAEARLAYYAGRYLPGTGGLGAGTHPRGSVPFLAGAQVELVRTWPLGDWQVGGSAGIGARFLVGSFKSDISSRQVLWRWAYPTVGATVRRRISRRSFGYVRLGAEYDVLDSSVGPVTFTWSAGAGLGF